MIKSYRKIITETLDKALAKDNSIFLIGEDIGRYGGAFAVTKSLFEKYGPKRIIDSPMCEQTIVGFSIGSALNGLRPIVEIMFMDFVTLIYDQLFNHASIFSYISDGKLSVPLVIRVAAGGGRGYGATHSKTLIAPLMHIPGIKIVAPSNVRDAKGLLNSSIKDNNPVIYIEHKSLYETKEDTTDIEEYIPIGKAKVVKEGNNLTIITFSKTVNDCVQIADKLEDEDISIEVIDLRTIKPIDMDTIKQSIEKTKKVVIIEEGYSVCGVASELISKINETCFYSLDAPIKRVCSLDVPIPCCPAFENEIIPSLKRIESAIRDVLNE